MESAHMNSEKCCLIKTALCWLPIPNLYAEKFSMKAVDSEFRR